VEDLSIVHLQNGGGREDIEEEGGGGGGETDLAVMVRSWTVAFSGVVVVGMGRNSGSCCNSSSPLCRDITRLLFFMVFFVFPSIFSFPSILFTLFCSQLSCFFLVFSLFLFFFCYSSSPVFSIFFSSLVSFFLFCSLVKKQSFLFFLSFSLALSKDLSIFFSLFFFLFFSPCNLFVFLKYTHFVPQNFSFNLTSPPPLFCSSLFYIYRRPRERATLSCPVMGQGRAVSAQPPHSRSHGMTPLSNLHNGCRWGACVMSVIFQVGEGEGDNGIAGERIFFFPCLYVSRGRRRPITILVSFLFFLVNSAWNGAVLPKTHRFI